MSKEDAEEIDSASDSTAYMVPNDGRPNSRAGLALSSQETTPLAKLLRVEKLPQCIRMTKNFLVSGSQIRFKKGDVLMLHFVYTKPVIHATDSKKGKVLRLPLHNRQEFEILPLDPLLDDKVYEGTAALINAKPLPDRVRVVDAHCSIHQEEQQCSDDIIQIEKIEIDKGLGKVLVGKLMNPLSEHFSPCRFSKEMTFSSYTTMIESEFERLTQLKARRFPLRVRIPDMSLGLGQRNRNAERVLRLLDYSDDECVLATRSRDNSLYCLPLSTPLSLESAPLPTEQQISAFLLPLYANVNKTWNVVDPLQAGLSPLLEETPQPIEEVLVPWLESWEGKRRMKSASAKNDVERRKLDRKKDEEIRRLESAIESYKHQLGQKGLVETPPPRPPRAAERGREAMPPSTPDKPPKAPNIKPKDVNSRRPLPEPTFNPQTNRDDDNDNKNGFMSELKSVFRQSSSMSSDEVYCEVFSENESTNERTDEMRTKYDNLLNKYNDIKDENLKLKDEKKILQEKIQRLQDLIDEGEEYSMIGDCSTVQSKPYNYAKIKSSKHVQTKSEVSKQAKGAVPVSPATVTSNDYSPQPVKEPKPPVPIRTDSRKNSQSDIPPVATPRTSLDDRAKTVSVDSNIIMSDSQASKDKNATPTITPIPPIRVSKLPSKPPSDPISPTLDPKPNMDVVHSSPTRLPLEIHSGLTKEDVASFLESCNLGKYSESFIQNDVDGELLLALDEQIMIDELGLRKLDARKLSLVLKKKKCFELDS